MRSMQRRTFFLSLVVGVLAAAGAGTNVSAQGLDGLELTAAGGMAGITIYEPGRWGLVRTTVSNRGDAARTPLVAHAVGEHRHIQFAHRLWVPAHSMRTQLTPVRPLSDSRDERSFEMQTWMIDDSAGRERATPPSEGLLIAARGSFQLGAMLDREDQSPGEAAAALREAAGHGRGAAYTSDDAAPALPAAWDVLDAFVLARTPDLSPAQLDAMRRWVLGGGRLWVMLDKTDPAFMERLLGDAWEVSVADRVWLDAMTINDVASGDAYAIDREAGTSMLRVHAPRMTVTHEAAGYPVAAWQRVGRGRVMMTTAHVSALLEAGEDEEGNQSMVAAPPLEALTWFFDARRRAAASENQSVDEAMAGQARAQIGYNIISRTPVFIALGVFALALLGGGMLLLRWDQLEWIGVAGVVLAVVTSAVLVGMGKLRQSDYEMTLAAAELVEPVRGQPYAAVRGSFSVFRPDHAPGRVTFAGPGEAIAFPDDVHRSSERVRIIWHGLDRWTLPDLSLPAGAARRFVHDRVAAFEPSMTASVGLTDDGLVGQVHGAAGVNLADAVIAMPNGRIATRVSEDGGFASTLDDRLAGEQYVHAAALGTLSQTQMSRQAAYRRLLGSGDFPDVPTLLAWSDADEPAVEMSEPAARRGETLLALPLQIERPAAGERVTVPAPMMVMRTHRAGPGAGGATVYDEQNREWISPISQPTSMFMRFEPPVAVRSIDVDAAVLELDLHAPGWQYEVLRVRGDDVEVVHTGRNPAGRMAIALDADQAPRMEADGVVIGLRIEPNPGATGGRGWSLEQMALRVQGVAR